MNAGMLTLYRPLIDWITLTSFHEGMHTYWQQLLYKDVGKTEPEIHKRLNYSGPAVDTGEGTLFVGEGEQRQRPHYMVQVGGETANDHLTDAIHCIESYSANVTTLDIQITIPMPASWSQFDLLGRMKERGKLVGWAESRDKKAGEMQTVYIGSWQSEKFTRVYVKLTDGNEKLLRYEIRLKRDIAESALEMIQKGRATVGQILRHELQRCGDIELRNLYESSLVGIIPVGVRVKRRSSRVKQREWLLDVALPSLRRYINSKEASPQVAKEFAKVLEYGNYYDNLGDSSRRSLDKLEN